MATPLTDILIVGAGPAGMMAALAAHHTAPGLCIEILEGSDRPGKKLDLTGGGRGNFTRLAEPDELVAAFGPRGRLLYTAFYTFGPRAIRDYFHKLGVPSMAEADGRVFPRSEQAVDLTAALTRALRDAGIPVRCQEKVHRIERIDGDTGQAYRVTGRTVHTARAVILAGGACSYPATGSDGSCAAAARRLGLPLRPFSPALTGIRVLGDHAPGPSGISVEASISYRTTDGRKVKDRGTVLRTRNGYSGPLIMRHSAVWGRPVPSPADDPVMLRERPIVRLTLHLLPDETEDTAYRRILDARQESPTRFIQHLDLPVPQSLRVLAADKAGVSRTRAADLTAAEMRRYVRALTDHTFEARVLPIGGATACDGGIPGDALDSGSLEAQAFPGLYVAGELLDLTGPSGGYHLTMAFATGHLAGESAALRLI